MSFVRQAQKLILGVEHIAAKEGIGKTARTLHPTKAQALIKQK